MADEAMEQYGFIPPEDGEDDEDDPKDPPDPARRNAGPPQAEAAGHWDNRNLLLLSNT